MAAATPVVVGVEAVIQPTPLRKSWARCQDCLMGGTVLRVLATSIMTRANRGLNAFAIRITRVHCLCGLTTILSSWHASRPIVKRTPCVWVSSASHSSLPPILNALMLRQPSSLKWWKLKRWLLKMASYSTSFRQAVSISRAYGSLMRTTRNWMCSSSRQLAQLASTTSRIAFQARRRRSSPLSGARMTRMSIVNALTRRTILISYRRNACGTFAIRPSKKIWLCVLLPYAKSWIALLLGAMLV